MLRERKEYRYETEQVDMSSTTLDAIVSNLSTKIGKMMVKLHLKDTQKETF